MAKTRTAPPSSENVISIIATGMRIVGDCDSAHTIRIDGTVDGTVRAQKGVVIGKSGRVTGDIHTADAKIAGSIKGTLMVESRLELEATAVVDGEIQTARLKLDEGAIVNGAVAVGRQEPAVGAAPPARPERTEKSARTVRTEKSQKSERSGKNGTLFSSGEKRKASA